MLRRALFLILLLNPGVSDFPSDFLTRSGTGATTSTTVNHIEGLRAIVRYQKPTDATYAADIAELELGDDLAEPLTKP